MDLYIPHAMKEYIDAQNNYSRILRNNLEFRLIIKVDEFVAVKSDDTDPARLSSIVSVLLFTTLITLTFTAEKLKKPAVIFLRDKRQYLEGPT